MKRFLISLLALALIFASVLPSFAISSPMGPSIIDSANLLTESEEQSLSERINTIEEKHNIDIIIATADFLWNGITMRGFADSIKETYAETDDCAVLVICMDYEGYREYKFQGYGKVYDVFTDDVVYYLEDICLEHLSNEDFAAAFEAFAETTDEMIDLYDAGTPYETPVPWGMLVILSLGAGFIVALIVVLIMAAQLKSVHRQSAAREYVKKGSLNVTERRDLYLYSTVTRVPRPKNNSSGGSGGSHSRGGGGGGRF